MTPREWWITGPNDGYNGIYNQEPEAFLNPIHVIEYSAYEALKESLILAKKQRDELHVILNEAAETICGEFCSQKHHPLCVYDKLSKV